jgi:phosphatidylglycerol:prolipoprotein diacylglycerol transferase
VTFRNSAASTGVPLNRPLHPTQLYEAAAEFAIFGVLFWRFHQPHAKGTIIASYLTMYSAARFVVEFFRYHEQGNLFGGPLDTSQWISLAFFALGAAWLVAVRRRTAAQPA